MEVLGLSHAQRAAVWRALAAVLHLGRLGGGAAGGEAAGGGGAAAAGSSAHAPDAVVSVARLLGTSTDAMWRALSAGGARGGGGVGVGGGGSVGGGGGGGSAAQQGARADALCRWIVGRVFDWLAEQVCMHAWMDG